MKSATMCRASSYCAVAAPRARRRRGGCWRCTRGSSRRAPSITALRLLRAGGAVEEGERRCPALGADSRIGKSARIARPVERRRRLLVVTMIAFLRGTRGDECSSTGVRRSSSARRVPGDGAGADGARYPTLRAIAVSRKPWISSTGMRSITGRKKPSTISFWASVRGMPRACR